MHSSRVGVSTSACTSSSAGSTNSIIGRPNAAVLPVPVCAWPMTSCPARSSGIACSWMGLGASYPTSSRAWRIAGESPSSVKLATTPHDRARLRLSCPRMSLTVVGSIAFDAVETQTGRRDRLLGGSAVHFSLASSFFDETRVVGPVGDDFGEEEYAALRSRGGGTDDIEHVPGGKTLFWAARYERIGNVRRTLQTDLNVFERFQPSLSEAAASADVVFVANMQPDLQREVREQCHAARFVAMDSMNLWIEIADD